MLKSLKLESQRLLRKTKLYFCEHESLFVRGDSPETTFYECRRCFKEIKNNSFTLKIRRLICRHAFVIPIREEDETTNYYCSYCGKPDKNLFNKNRNN